MMQSGNGNGDRRKREVVRRGVARVGLVAAAGFGIDPRVLGISCGFALRAAVATFGILQVVLQRIAAWVLVRACGLAVWTVRALVAVLDWVGATY